MQLMIRKISHYLLGLLILPCVTSGLQVVLGSRAVISCHRNCSDKVEWLRRGNPVVGLDGGNLSVAAAYEGRIEFSLENLRKGNISLVITHTVYNDRSWYVCSCDGNEDCDQYLDVLLPVSVKVTVGDQATLPCYAETNKFGPESNASVRWEKDGALVVKLENGEMEFGAGFEDRASVSMKKYSRGDLSLSISEVKISDTGFYRCFHLSEKDTHPEIIHLITNDSSPSYLNIACVIIIVVILALVLYAFRRELHSACRRLREPPQHDAVPGADEK